MGDTAASVTGGPLQRRWPLLRRLRSGAGASGTSGTVGTLLSMAFVACVAFVGAGCTPDYNWRDARGPGGEYRVQFPAKPATLTRGIHLENAEVEMTMQGARVDENAFTVGLVPLRKGAAGLPPERVVAAMREQMLRNIGAPPSTPLQAADVDLVDAQGRKVGRMQLQAVGATGSGRHAGVSFRGRFGVWRDHALQIVAIGPDLDPEQAEHFLDSLQLVNP